MIRIEDNHSNKFLKPIINTFGNTFLKELNNLTNFALGYPVSQSILKFGIGDTFYFRAKQYQVGCLLFVLFDINGPYNTTKNFYVDVKKGKGRFRDFLLFVRKSSWYSDDYWYQKGQHCIVFDLRKFEQSYLMFLQSKFSEMYSKEQLKAMEIPKEFMKNKKKVPNYIYAVLSKDSEIGRKYLAHQIYEHFGTKTLPDEPDEFDITWIPNQEIFNYQYMTDGEKEFVKQMKSNDYKPEISNRVTANVF